MKSKKIIWRKHFSGQRVDYQVFYPTLEEFYESPRQFLGRTLLTRAFMVFEGRNVTGFYVFRDELRAFIKATLQKILRSPDIVDALHRRTIAVNRRYFAFARRIETMNHQHMNDRELILHYEQIMQLQQRSHEISLPTTWFVDSDGEDFSLYLRQYIADRIAAMKSREEVSNVFSILTTPLQDSTGRIEELELLNLLVLVKRSRVALRTFTAANAEHSVNFQNLPTAIARRIQAHYKKWRWTCYTYIGPAYELDFYLEQLRGMLVEHIDPVKVRQKYRRIHQENRVRQQELFRNLRIDSAGQHIFRIAQDVVFIKEYRKNCLYYGCYVRDMLLSEVARRLGISLMQAKYFVPSEVGVALLKRRVDPDELTARMTKSLLVMERGRTKVLMGLRAKQFLARQRFERVKISTAKELRGTCASPGHGSGVVKVINFPEEMGKMEKGNVMLSHTTFPSLLPAMKKAAAIVTEDGGITCHAAIVSRELKIPCVVGVKAATKVFKDGDIVDVDANNGVVRKA